MTNHYKEDDIEIIPPSRAPVRASTPAPTRLPADPYAGDLFERPLVRFDARSRALTYEALTEAAEAKREYAQADAALRRSLTERARAQAEFDELPELIGAERHMRRTQRKNEIRQLEHQGELAEMHHETAMTQAAGTLTNARANLTDARERLVGAQRRLLDATQQYEAQRKYGVRYHALGWERKIGEQTLYVEEQEAVLDEHRQRVRLLNHDSREKERIERQADGDASVAEAQILTPRHRAWKE